MSLSLMLRKLGLLRSGTEAATYRGQDRPAEFLMDEVLQAEKDLTTREDLEKVATGLKAAGFRQGLFWGVVALAALALLALAAGGGLSLWLLVDLALWAGILLGAYRFAYQSRLSPWKMGGLVALGLLLSLMFLGLTASP